MFRYKSFSFLSDKIFHPVLPLNSIQGISSMYQKFYFLPRVAKNAKDKVDNLYFMIFIKTNLTVEAKDTRGRWRNFLNTKTISHIQSTEKSGANLHQKNKGNFCFQRKEISKAIKVSLFLNFGMLRKISCI